jgi:hypothetical protein
MGAPHMPTRFVRSALRPPAEDRRRRRVTAWFAPLFLAGAVAGLHGGTVELAIVAAMKVPDLPNYTWSTIVDDDARSYRIDGRTERQEDFSIVTMPLVASLRRGLGRAGSSSVIDDEITAVFKGDDRLVIQVGERWIAPAELEDTPRGRNSRRSAMGSRGTIRRAGASSGRGSNPNAYSNLQLALSRPHEEIAIIVANSTDLHAEPDGLSGTLSETGAKLLLVHAGQPQLTPVLAGGTFRLWIRDGTLFKYQVRLEGTIAVSTRNDRVEVQVHQTATTTVTNPGRTEVDVPDAARRRLDS